MDKLYLQFILLLVALSVISWLVLRMTIGEVDVGMVYAFTMLSASGAGKWYAAAAVAARSSAEAKS